MKTETETSDLALKLATLKRITFEQAEALAVEKGATLTRESEKISRFGRQGSYTITKSRWYKLSTVPDKKLFLLTNVRDFLLQ